MQLSCWDARKSNLTWSNIRLRGLGVLHPEVEYTGSIKVWGPEMYYFSLISVKSTFLVLARTVLVGISK